MARKAGGGEWLEEAKACLAKAKTVEELRQAQAVVLPLDSVYRWTKQPGPLAYRSAGPASCGHALCAGKARRGMAVAGAAAGDGRT